MYKCLIVGLLAIGAIRAWHTCSDEAFCARLRNREANSTQFRILKDTISFEQEHTMMRAEAESNTGGRFHFLFAAQLGGIYAVQLWPQDFGKNIPTNPSLKTGKASKEWNYAMADEVVTIVDKDATVTISINDLSITVTDKRTKHVTKINTNSNLVLDGSVAVSFTFENTQSAYGIPEHGDHLRLSDTRDKDPYRLFNLDYGYYAVESQEALYGSVPVLYAHGPKHTSGVFVDNPSQTFVDIHYNTEEVSADFISESGILSAYILNGGSFKAAVTQYQSLTAPGNLPPMFALGYHQSRYSYLTQEDLETVNSQLDENDFPTDVLWLDIDYTDAKKYFTWNYTAYPNPLSMQAKIKEDGRKLVTIIDPHIKVEKGYRVYDEMLEKGFYVRNPDGTPFEGPCWPGLSSYVDFVNPDARDWWGDQYLFENYPNTTDIVHIWNDMNEPSVFDVEEKTMMRDLSHFGNLTHKDIHNMYGMLQVVGTYHGLIKRSENQRPFVLTRAHYAGIQGYSAIWTGDNIATWEHLRVSVAMCLSEALAGVSFCGADVGGFIENPTHELNQRWYQLGAWYPFFRSHSNNEGPRREPYLYPKEVQDVLRAAIKQRYSHLPYWYTVWYQHENINYEPVIRPLIYEFPKEDVASIESEFLVGKDILVAPVLHPNVTQLDVYLPGGKKWYHHTSNGIEISSGSVTIPVDITTTPVFYRAGSIIPRKDISRKSSEFMRDDPLTLYLYLNEHFKAVGYNYIDDTKSFDYRDGKFSYARLTFEAETLTGTFIGENRSQETNVIGEVRIHRMQPKQYQKAIFSSSLMRKEFTDIVNEGNTVIVKNLNIDMNAIDGKFTINFV